MTEAEKEIKQVIAEIEDLRLDSRKKSESSGLSNCQFGSYCGQEYAYKTAILKLERLLSK